jgi:hypothetical protein
VQDDRVGNGRGEMLAWATIDALREPAAPSTAATSLDAAVCVERRRSHATF